MLRYGAVLRVKEVDLERAEGWFGRYDDAVVLFGKVVPGLRSLVSVPAGMLRMPLWRISLLTALGAAVWNALLLGAGWFWAPTGSGWPG